MTCSMVPAESCLARRIMRKFFLSTLLLIWISTGLSGCENTDLQLATQAGIEAYKAITLSDQQVAKLAGQTSALLDSEQPVAPDTSHHAKRLRALVGDLHKRDGYTFNYKVYQRDEVNAFAMADGSIRVFGGLMDLLDDDELLFVIGHEMGHVVQQHSRNQLRIAYAASAVRKGLAAQDGMTADIARSQLGALVQRLTNAQYSQIEEKVADDYGLSFLKAEGHDPKAAVSALQKLAALGSGSSIFSSHPDSGLRAERIALQIQGKAIPVEETREGLLNTIKAKVIDWYKHLWDYVAEFIRSFTG